jgi:hypothetical protein
VKDIFVEIFKFVDFVPSMVVLGDLFYTIVIFFKICICLVLTRKPDRADVGIEQTFLA